MEICSWLCVHFHLFVLYFLSVVMVWLNFLCIVFAYYKHQLQNPRKEVNAVLKKEAAYFGDIVILPFMDRYELVVIKTVAICEFGVSSILNV